MTNFKNCKSLFIPLNFLGTFTGLKWILCSGEAKFFCTSLILLLVSGTMSAQVSPGFTWKKTSPDTCTSVFTTANIRLRNTTTGTYSSAEWLIRNSNGPAFFTAKSKSHAEIAFDPHFINYLPADLDVSLVITDSSGTDTVTQSIPMGLHFAPIANFDPNYVDSVSAGTPVSFTSYAQPVSGASISSYHWDFGDGSGSSSASPSHSYSTPGDYYVKHFVTDNTGCASETSEKAVSARIVVK